MGKPAIAYSEANKKPQDKPQPKKWSAQERMALKKIRREAKAAGATLETNGEGGLPPSLVLGAMRRDRFACVNEHCPTPKKNITVDHISGHPKEIAQDKGARKRKDLRRGIKLGHVNVLAAIHTLCAQCHDRVHDREREIDHGEKPQPMRGA
jgi:hypothetical protein